MAKVYVASSWRNPYQPNVVARLREAGHEVYDFRNPAENPGGFHWADVDARWQEWTAREYIGHLDHPVAEKGFQADFRAMEARLMAAGNALLSEYERTFRPDQEEA